MRGGQGHRVAGTAVWAPGRQCRSPGVRGALAGPGGASPAWPWLSLAASVQPQGPPPFRGASYTSAWEYDVRSLHESVAHITNTCPQVFSGEQVPPCRVTPFRTRRESQAETGAAWRCTEEMDFLGAKDKLSPSLTSFFGEKL